MWNISLAMTGVFIKKNRAFAGIYLQICANISYILVFSSVRNLGHEFLEFCDSVPSIGVWANHHMIKSGRLLRGINVLDGLSHSIVISLLLCENLRSSALRLVMGQTAVSWFLYNINLSAGILEQSIGTQNRVGIGLSYRPARPRLRRLAESIPRILESFKIPSLVRTSRITFLSSRINNLTRKQWRPEKQQLAVWEWPVR